MEPETVRRILHRQFPQLAAEHVTYLGAGMDSVAFEVDQRWVFRFPMRAEIERQLFVERAVLPVLAPRLAIPIPHFEFAGKPDDDIGWHFAGYAKLPGHIATMVDQSRIALDAVAAQIGPFLSAVHAFPVAAAAKLGTQTVRLEDHFAEVRTSALETNRGLAGQVQALSTDAVERYIEKLRRFVTAPWPFTLTHHDLAAEHVLLGDDIARVTGVIDWGDVSIGDPTVDFVGLFAWGGEALVRSVLAHYEGPVDERVLERVRPWAAFRAVQDIRFGLDNGQPEIVAMGIRALKNEISSA